MRPHCVGCRQPIDYGCAILDRMGRDWCYGCVSFVLASHCIGKHPEQVMTGVKERVHNWLAKAPLLPAGRRETP